MKQQKTFASIGIQSEIIKSLQLLGYEKPTKVQQMVLNEIDTTKDLCVKAKTGSGKIIFCDTR